MKFKMTLVSVLMFCVFVTSSWAGSLPVVKPEAVGLSATRLERLTAVLKSDVDKGIIPGAVMLIARKGKIAYFQSFGMRDKAAGSPMEKDAIFRIYSMWKPYVATVAMIMAEEGKLMISDAISKYIPEFKKMTVGLVKEDGTLTTDPAKRQITVQDLLRHTSGLTYGVFGKSPIKTLYKEAGVHKQDQTIADMCQKLSKLPLVTDPGSKWEYSRSFDVLARVLEIIDGKPIDQILHQRLFSPLGMVDSCFYLEEEKATRLAQPAANTKTGKVPHLVKGTAPRPKFIPGTCLSSAEDYFRFTQMLLNGGELNGTRLISRKTVEYMTADQLGKLADRNDSAFLPGPGCSYGLGFGIRIATGLSNWQGTVGNFFWNGYAGTAFWVDPKEELIGIFMDQEPSTRNHYRRIIRTLVYQAIAD